PLTFQYRPSRLPIFFAQSVAGHKDLPSFPTRRSSDLQAVDQPTLGHVLHPRAHEGNELACEEQAVVAMTKNLKQLPRRAGTRQIDRKSTRLNSSHRTISYAVFCLKKKCKSIHEQ